MIGDRMLDKTATHYRPTENTTSTGRTTITVGAALATGLGCARQPISDKLRQTLAGMEGNASEVVYLDGAPDIRQGDRLVIGSDALLVLEAKDMGGRGEALRCLVTDDVRLTS